MLRIKRFDFSAFLLFSVYNTCTLLLNHRRYNVDANLDASDNVISGNEPSSNMLTSQSLKP